MPLPGTLNETLYWNGVEWQPTNFLRTEPNVGVGIDLMSGSSPLDKLHIDDASGTGNFARWTSLAAPNGGRIGHAGGQEFQIRQEEPANIEFWVNSSPQVYINEQPNVPPVLPTPFLGVGRNNPIGLAQVNPAINPSALPLGIPVYFASEGSGEFNGDVTALGDFWNPSDETLKESFQSLNTDWKRILSVPAYSYRFKENGEFNFPKTKSYGFKAQEVKQHIPELVTHNGKFHLVNYNGFVPFLTQGLQEHEERLNALERPNEVIEELKVENGELKAENQILRTDLEAEKAKNEEQEKRLKALEEIVYRQQDKGTGNSFGQTGVLGEPPALEQNEPNPFTQETIIRYFLPEGAVNAKIEVRNVENKIVGSFPVSQAGYGNITLSASTLAAGNYFYSLIINNKIVDTKKMILLN